MKSLTPVPRNLRVRNLRMAALLLLTMAVSGLLPVHAQAPKEIIGYYCSWRWYNRNNLVSPTTIAYGNYSILNYAFLYPLADGSLMITDPWADKNLLLGQINWQVAPAGYDTSYNLGNPAYHLPQTSLAYHAHNNDNKLLVSLGGFTLGQHFPGVAADPVKRTTFAHSCSEIIRLYDLDGIDIDWEYPAPGDRDNYTLLLQEVRDSLEVLEQSLSRELLLTIAAGAAYERMAAVDWSAMVGILDYVNLMSYDFFGTWNTFTDHNAPLFYPGFADSTFNTDHAVRHLIDFYQVPSTMINIGAPFYGRSQKTTGDPGLNVPSEQVADLITFAEDAGNPVYFNILNQQQLFENHWDDQAQVPYMTGVDGLKTFLSYDNKESIAKKAEYVMSHNLAGVIIWEITGDYLETFPGSGIIESTPLADTLMSVLWQPGSSVDESTTDGIPLLVYPVPTGNLLYIETESTGITQIRIYHSSGQLMGVYPGDQRRVNTTNYKAGLYYLRVVSNDQSYGRPFIKQ